MLGAKHVELKSNPSASVSENSEMKRWLIPEYNQNQNHLITFKNIKGTTNYILCGTSFHISVTICILKHFDLSPSKSHSGFVVDVV